MYHLKGVVWNSFYLQSTMEVKHSSKAFAHMLRDTHYSTRAVVFERYFGMIER